MNNASPVFTANGADRLSFGEVAALSIGDDGDATDDGEEQGPKVEIDNLDMGDAAAEGEETSEFGEKGSVVSSAVFGEGVSGVCLRM